MTLPAPGEPEHGLGTPGDTPAAELLLSGRRSSTAGPGIAAPVVMPGPGEGRAVLGRARRLLACQLTEEGDAGLGWVGAARHPRLFVSGSRR